MSAFEELERIAPQELWSGLVARSIHGEQITLAVVEIDPGAPLPEHSHGNEQLGLVLRGSLELTVGGEPRVLHPGELWRIPANTPHSGTAGSDGAVVVDVFSPPREDWQHLDAIEQRPLRWPS